MEIDGYENLQSERVVNYKITTLLCQKFETAEQTNNLHRRWLHSHFEKHNKNMHLVVMDIYVRW